MRNLIYDQTASTTALSNSLQASAASCMLGTVSGYNTGPDQFIQVHDAASAPANGAVPKLVLKAFANQYFSFDFASGAKFSNGIYVCNSTTAATKTLGAANCLFDVVYKQVQIL